MVRGSLHFYSLEHYYASFRILLHGIDLVRSGCAIRESATMLAVDPDDVASQTWVDTGSFNTAGCQGSLYTRYLERFFSFLLRRRLGQSWFGDLLAFPQWSV